MDASQADVLIGRAGSDHVAFWILRAHRDGYDWLVAELEVCVAAWRGAFETWMTQRDLGSFRAELERLDKELRGTASLALMEGNLSLDLAVDVTGHLAVRGEARHDPASTTRLLFTLDGLDQTDLAPLIGQLRDVERRYSLASGSSS